MTKFKFQPGDRVTRHSNVFDRSSSLMHGTVTRVYTKPGYTELYQVQWDNYKHPSNGYLPHGIDREGN